MTATATTTTTTGVSPLEGIVQSQLNYLDDTDCYATAWREALLHSNGRWGGRGKGGRALGRRTTQPHDVVVSDVSLAYVGNAAGSCTLLLENAQLKLLSGHVYCLLGKNGSGKSSLLRRIASGRIPGFPPHVNVLYIPQEIVCNSQDLTPLEYLLQIYKAQAKVSKEAVQADIEQLETLIDNLNVEDEEEQRQLEELGEKLSSLEEQLIDEPHHALQRKMEDALEFMTVSSKYWSASLRILSPGVQKKIMLAVAMLCPCNLLLLDEPATHLDVSGLLQLRRLVEFVTASQNDSGHPATVLMTSHDLDLINDAATDVIELSNAQLYYSPGNYDAYLGYKQQHDIHSLRQTAALDRKQNDMAKTLENLKKQAVSKRGGANKIGKQIDSHRKKMEKEGINADAKGHRWTAQNTGSGIKAGSINSIDASTRRNMTTQELLKMAQQSVRPPPDKGVQFAFRNPSSEWGEPLIRAFSVGHAYDIPANGSDDKVVFDPLRARDGYLFDNVDLCVEEHGRYCILGESNSGKSVLLRLLAKLEEPLEGSIHHALNVDIGYMDQRMVDGMIETSMEDETALSYLTRMYPMKKDQELRTELISFGLSTKQSCMSVRFLSGGERRRLAMAFIMLRDPQVLILDQPTADLDPMSVEALIHGLKNWKGTLILSTHDTHFLRSLEVDCYALVDGRLRHVVGGVDQYLRSFAEAK
ncbi:hypothetical protein MPSEU_001015200 [Mayamaea pseudoterrestris]|nr:hypothetical protein MPSEU_001015200 [Mayamaea pseudoterrestris]